MVPPRHLNFVGDGDFVKTGNEFLEYFIRFGHLSPNHSVLEVGSGIGRMARALTQHLTSGSYDGIDIVPSGIRWCQQNISTRYPQFRFHLADLHNLDYNPAGTIRAADYRFPFQDNQFDFVFLTSVFTHMIRRDVSNYMREISRVLRGNAMCLMTWFLLNEESCRLIEGGLSSIQFPFLQEGYRINDRLVPEKAVAFAEEEIQALYRELGFKLVAIYHGAWPGRVDYLSYQDVIIARKI